MKYPSRKIRNLSRKSLACLSILLIFSLISCTIHVNGEMLTSPSKEIDFEALRHLTTDLEYKELQISSENNEVLYSLYKHDPSSNKTIVMFHGNASNISQQPWFGILKALAGLQANIFVFDYQGFGLSGGAASFSKMRSDANTIMRYLVDTIDQEHELYIYGLSVGSVFAFDAAAVPNVKGIIIEGGITTPSEMMDFYKSKKFMGRFTKIVLADDIQFDNLHEAENLNKPLLVIHGKQDKSIPFEMGRRIFEKSNTMNHAPLSSFYAVENGQHCNSFAIDKEQYISHLAKFIQENKS